MTLISSDLPCSGCGYNLRTLGRDALCPECALPVAKSLDGAHLESADPMWLRRQMWGLRLLITSSVLLSLGTYFSLTPWPMTALLGLGISGPRSWLMMASRQIVGIHDPREIVTLPLTIGGVLLHLWASYMMIREEPGRITRHRRIRDALLFSIILSAALLAYLLLYGWASPKFWGRYLGLCILASIDLAHGGLLCPDA